MSALAHETIAILNDQIAKADADERAARKACDPVALFDATERARMARQGRTLALSNIALNDRQASTYFERNR
jgi:hypothetical protein